MSSFIRGGKFPEQVEEMEDELIEKEKDVETQIREIFVWMTPAYVLLIVFLLGIAIACAGIYSYGDESDEKLAQIDEKLNLLLAENERNSNLLRTLQYEIAVTGDCSSGPPTVGCIMFEFYFYFMFAQRNTIVANEEDVLIVPASGEEEGKRFAIRKDPPVAIENTGHHSLTVPGHRKEIMDMHTLGKTLRLARHTSADPDIASSAGDPNVGLVDDLQL